MKIKFGNHSNRRIHRQAIDKMRIYLIDAKGFQEEKIGKHAVSYFRYRFCHHVLNAHARMTDLQNIGLYFHKLCHPEAYFKKQIKKRQTVFKNFHRCRQLYIR